MRGVIVVMVTLFTVAAMMLFGVAVVEPIGERVKGYGATDTVNGTSTINNVYESYFKWTPLVLISGMMVYAVAWYLRRESNLVGGRRY